MEKPGSPRLFFRAKQLKLNTTKLAKVLLALVLSAAVTAITVFVAIYLGQTALYWFEGLEPRTRKLFTRSLLLMFPVLAIWAVMYLRRAKKSAS